MKTFTRLVLTAALLLTAIATQASSGRGYVRSNGSSVAPHYRSGSGSLGGTTRSSYVYRNPYAASPSVGVRGYTRSDGTLVDPHARQPHRHRQPELSRLRHGSRAAVLSISVCSEKIFDTK